MSRVLNDEEKRLLEGLAPFSVESTTEYIPACYLNLPEELKVVFTVRPFKKHEAESVGRTIKAVKDSDEAKLRDFARQVIVGLENLHDAATGEPIAFEEDPTGCITKQLFDRIPVTVVTDVLMYVCKISGLIAAEKQGL